MTSIARTYASRKEDLTEFLRVSTPCYYNGSYNLLFPFTYSNNVLDITYEGNNFKEQMVDNTGNAPNRDANTAISILGGTYLITSLGEKFKEYIRAWRTDIDAGSPINVVIAAQMYRVQEADILNVNGNANSYNVNTSLPSSDNYVAGSVENKYQTTLVFKTPLTFTTVELGETKYITFKTMFDIED